MFHKRGLLTDLTNWRGLFLSNFLANSPISWLTTELTAYSSRMGIVPETQVAVQQGVQTRDLMSFLAAVQTWSERHKQTVYALKRDQMKGFDYLAPEGFYDAVRAYGLPQSIIDLDRAAQVDTKCRIRTYYGPTAPIVVSGVTKQGGPASPLKAIYTTSLGHRYLDDIAAQDVDSLVITTSNALKADPHRRDDTLQVMVSMAEATDDSFLFAKSLRTFPIIRTGLDFLNAKVDDPGARFAELKDIIDAFNFPRLTGRLPITLLRKIVAQNIVSRCRALLSLQPIKQADAEALDVRISTKIHGILGMPFSPSSKILTLPVSLHGLGFPSMARINAGIAVDGLVRDLNHHIAAYRTMARITLAEWTCDINGCVYPLDGDGLLKGFTHYYKKIPAAWITAQAVMSSMDDRLSLRMTDQHDLLIGAVSISHAVALCNHHNPDRADNPDGHALRTMRAKNIRTLADLGYWRNDETDGSMIPASASLCESRRVTAAVTGPSTLVVQLNGRNLSILHGELMGHILALVLKSNADPAVIPTLYSDHQNSVDLIEDIQTQQRVNMLYTRGHSAELSLPSQLNREADHYACGSQRFPELVPVAPTPTFTMDAYTLYTKVDGWVESNARNFIDFFLAKEAAERLAHGNRLRMLNSVHDNIPPPDYPYTRALSIRKNLEDDIALYARSGQLPTAVVLESRSKLPSCMCRLGCDAVESVHHIFVDCVEFKEWRCAAGEEVSLRTERKLVEAGIVEEEDQRAILKAAKSLFVDDAAVWPLKISQYYLGRIPRIGDIVTREMVPDTVKRRKLASHLSADWHTSAIRLAGRIFGSIQRTMAARASS
ncbi:hypothetical protein GGX14DRAFT_365159 [Mycena pura]|uniref:Reverse transcriptase domain-containing protein n=2 Tax=Mycena pura TaxID=153505 RepID=A0AAD6VDG2_9AGAR|nr:hypothetical protein GGX14DRAFT_365159 [Mycena pura]